MARINNRFGFWISSIRLIWILFTVGIYRGASFDRLFSRHGQKVFLVSDKKRISAAAKNILSLQAAAGIYNYKRLMDAGVADFAGNTHLKIRRKMMIRCVYCGCGVTVGTTNCPNCDEYPFEKREKIKKRGERKERLRTKEEKEGWKKIKEMDKI